MTYEILEHPLPTIRKRNALRLQMVAEAIRDLPVGGAAVFDSKPWSGVESPIKSFLRNVRSAEALFPDRFHRTGTLPDGRSQLWRTA